MNILIIGNGFDLCHNLPTRYSDFLDFCIELLSLHRNGKHSCRIIKNSYLSDEIFPRLEKDVCKYHSEKYIQILVELLSDNCWYSYFRNVIRLNGWVDFENEISRVVQAFNEKEISQKHTDEIIIIDSEAYHLIKKLITLEMSNVDHFTIKKSKLIEAKIKLLNALDQFTLAFQIYLYYYVRHLDISIPTSMEWLKETNIDALLSFNYTDTFERLYNSSLENTDYIHGKITDSLEVKDCNLVLGINEYLNAEERNQGITDCIEFKKFYQRIYKKTGCNYLNWLKNISKKDEYNNHTIIVGHSLDITDKDVLRDIILSPNMTTTVLYHNQEAFSRYIINMVRLLGEDTVISMVHGQQPSLYFVPLEDANNHIMMKLRIGKTLPDYVTKK